jgi:hypothetical protein
LPFLLIKKKRVGRLINGNLAKNWYKHPQRSSWNTAIARAHSHPGYQTKTSHTPLHTGVIVEVVSRRHYHHSSKSQRLRLHQEWPPTKTSTQRPHEARTGLSQRLAAPILPMSSEEEIWKTCAKENHHDWTACHMASSPQVQPQP